MGAGASTRKTKADGSAGASQDLPSRTEQGTKLGAEFEVTLIAPVLQGLQAKQKYILRVAYEAMVILDFNTHAPLSYFKYQDIICWGSTHTLFQFKVFGTVFGQTKGNFVAILFQTRQGRELEEITLKSVHVLMQDMECEGVSKQDFLALKGLLMLKSSEDEVASNWFDVVKQFASCRRYTCHQGTELMRMATQDGQMDSFELIEFAMFLWNSTLNRDSFQLILNVFHDAGMRENLIERIRLENPSDKSAALLQATCPDAGGGIVSPDPSSQ